MNRVVRLITAICSAPFLLGVAQSALAEEAEMADGTYLTGVGLEEWDVIGQQPFLRLPEPPGGKAPAPLMLFNATNSCRWVAGFGRPPAVKPDAFVEMYGGDVLPGKIAGFQYGDESLFNQQPPCLLIRTEFPTGAAGVMESNTLRVIVSDIRRLVCQQVSGGNYTPATLYYADGRRLVYRQLRWTKSGVTLLLDEGRTENVAFGDIGELHAARRDSWQAYYSTLAHLAPSGSNMLMRVEADMGLTATTSMDLFRVVNNYIHLIQPAWSPDPITIQRVFGRKRTFLAANEVPLSMAEPARVTQDSPLGGARQWRADRNTRLGSLRSGGRFWAWGLAAQAQNQFAFDLPPMARGFRTRVGLDQESGEGGCAKGLVYATAAEGTPLWQSPQLIGSSNVADSGVIPLSVGQKKLVLVADMSHQDRPAGADPLNIRDFIDWLQPTLDLDPQQLAAEVAKQLPQVVPAWQDWTVSAGATGRLAVAYRWEDERRYRIDSRAAGGRVLLRRAVDIPAKPTYLALGVVGNGSASTLDVRVNDLPVASFQAPPRGERMDPEPRFISLERWAGQSVTVEIEQFPTDDNSWVSWRGIAFMAAPEFGTPLAITSARVTSPDSAVTVETDGVVFVTQTVQAGNKEKAPVPDFDTYTITAETPDTDITGFRLELLTDPRLPNYGPGRLDGSVQLSGLKVSIAPKENPAQSEPVVLVDAASDSVWENYVARSVIDAATDNSWIPSPRSTVHAAVFMTDRPLGFPKGSVLTFTLDNKPFPKHLIGKFRLLTLAGPMPDPVPRPGVVVPLTDRGVEIFDEKPDFAGVINAQGSGSAATLDTTNHSSGSVSIRMGPGHRANDGFLGQVKICEKPGPGEARYLRFAWRKEAGQAIGLQLSHDGLKFGPLTGKPASFRYQAGPAPELGGAAVVVSKDLPADWVVVTRDLFADFGEFVLNGLSLDVPDGVAGNFDNLRLGRTLHQLEPSP